jgi:hypothetical protein
MCSPSFPTFSREFGKFLNFFQRLFAKPTTFQATFRLSTIDFPSKEVAKGTRLNQFNPTTGFWK